jgi:hypothetical protein
VINWQDEAEMVLEKDVCFVSVSQQSDVLTFLDGTILENPSTHTHMRTLSGSKPPGEFWHVQRHFVRFQLLSSKSHNQG